MYVSSKFVYTLQPAVQPAESFEYSFDQTRHIASVHKAVDVVASPLKRRLAGLICTSMCNRVCGFNVSDSARSSAIAEGPRDASCQLKSCQLPRNSAETTYTTSRDQIDGMKLEI